LAHIAKVAVIANALNVSGANNESEEKDYQPHCFPVARASHQRLLPQIALPSIMPHLESELEADAWPAVIVGIPIIAVGLIVRIAIGLIVTVGSIIWLIPIGVASIAAAMPIAISVPVTISIADVQNRGTCVAILRGCGRWYRPGRCGESQSRKACRY
jgi:hypothetical protein